MEDAEKERIAAAIRHYIAENSLSREQFAFKAKLSKSLIDKMLVGIFTEKGLAKLEANIGVRFRAHNIIKKASSEFYGGYTADEVKNYIGTYEFIRHDMQDIDVIHVYAMRIEWSEDRSCLVVIHQGIDQSGYRQMGQISIPKSEKYIFIISNGDGWHQLCILTKFNFTKMMAGGLFTLGNVSGSMFAPVATPLCMRKVESDIKTRKVRLGDDDYDEYRSILATVNIEKFLKFHYLNPQ